MSIKSAMRSGQTQVGLETTEGTLVAATRRPGSFSLEPSPNITTGMTKAEGQTAPGEGYIAFEDSSFSGSGTLTYDESILLLESGFVKVTPTTPTGATTARKRVYTVDQFASQTYQSYTVEVGDPGGTPRGQTAPGCSVNEWGFEVGSEDENVSMSASLLGGKLTDGGMTTTGVTSTAFRSVLPSHCKIYHATSFANLTSAPTEITSSFTAGFSMGDRRQLYRFLGKADTGPSGTVEAETSLQFDLTLADETSPVDTFMANARAGTKQYFRVQFLGPTIETTIKYEFTLDICCVLRDGPGRETPQGVLGRSFPYMAAYDSTAGKIMDLSIVNTTV